MGRTMTGEQRRLDDSIGTFESIIPPATQAQQTPGTTWTDASPQLPSMNTGINPSRLEGTSGNFGEGGQARLIETDPTTGADVPQIDSLARLGNNVIPKGIGLGVTVTVDRVDGTVGSWELSKDEYDSFIQAAGITGRIRAPLDSDSQALQEYLTARSQAEDWNDRVLGRKATEQGDIVSRAQFSAQFPGAIEEFEAMEAAMTYEEAIATEQGARAVGHKGQTLESAFAIGGEPVKQGIYALLAIRAAAAMAKGRVAGAIVSPSANPWIIGAATVGGFFKGWNDFATSQARESVTNADRIRADIEKGFTVDIASVNNGGSGRQAMANFDTMEKSARIAQAILKQETRTKTAAQRSEGISELEELEDLINSFPQRRQDLMNAIMNPNPDAIASIPIAQSQ